MISNLKQRMPVSRKHWMVAAIQLWETVQLEILIMEIIEEFTRPRHTVRLVHSEHWSLLLHSSFPLSLSPMFACVISLSFFLARYESIYVYYFSMHEPMLAQGWSFCFLLSILHFITSTSVRHDVFKKKTIEMMTFHCSFKHFHAGQHNIRAKQEEKKNQSFLYTYLYIYKLPWCYQYLAFVFCSTRFFSFFFLYFHSLSLSSA